MDTQGEKNGDTADTHTKKRTGRDKIKDKTKQINIQNNQKDKAPHKKDSIQQPAWASNPAEAIAHAFCHVLTKYRETHEAGEKLHERNVAGEN